MKSKMRQKIPKCRSKKGLSLVELIVGVLIIAMVLASASGVIVTGYKTTVDNASRNRAAAESASMNEVIMIAIKNCAFSSESEAEEHFFWNVDINGAKVSKTDPEKKGSDPVFEAVKKLYPDVHYIEDFSSSQYDFMYKLNIKAQRTLNPDNEVIKGIEITTAVATPLGLEQIVSFIPYRDQD